jgi:hypothetical protein
MEAPSLTALLALISLVLGVLLSLVTEGEWQEERAVWGMFRGLAWFLLLLAPLLMLVR